MEDRNMLERGKHKKRRHPDTGQPLSKSEFNISQKAIKESRPTRTGEDEKSRFPTGTVPRVSERRVRGETSYKEKKDR